MVPFSEYFRSVEWIWVIWAVSLVLLVWLTRRAIKSVDWKTAGSVFKEEDGAAYSLSYVLVFPIYVLLVLLVIECTLILYVKLGTIYSAYAAARSQIVWSSLVSKSDADDKANRAAIQAMVPYSSSWTSHARKVGIESQPALDGEDYYRAYNLMHNLPVDRRSYIVNKYRWAEFATTVKYERKQLGGPDEPWNADIKATVTYRMPLHAPAIGRIIGTRFLGPRGEYYMVNVTSSVTLQDEAAQNRFKSIGFRYVPD